MNAPNPTIWTLNSCFHAFCYTQAHLGLFGCLTRCKTGSASEFFTTNTTDPPPLDPKLMLFCISYYLGALGTIWLCYNAQSKTGQTGAKVRDTNSCQNFSQRTHPIHRIGPKTHFFCLFHTILVQLGLFGWLAKLDGKCAELVRKFVPRSRIGTFRNEHTRFTPLDPKLMFQCISY